MTEVSFAKSFLSALDARPQKLSADHVEDPKTYQMRMPYTLPKMPRPMSKRASKGPAPGAERSVTVHIHSLRNPPLDMRLTSQLLTTSLLDLKAAVAEQAGVPVGKIKMLHRKKPVADSKVLKDLAAEGESTVELSVMVMGGGAAAAAASAAAAVGSPKAEDGASSNDGSTAEGPSGEAVLATDEFWTDLRGFLSQRIRDEKVAEDLFGQFMSSWESSR